jgi:hypothetical protein
MPVSSFGQGEILSQSSQGQNHPEPDANLVRTPDGARTAIKDLNTGEQGEAYPTAGDKSPLGRLRRFWRNLNLVLAGMYTGLSCYGTPHEQHRYSQKPGDEADKPDNRPL